MGKNNIKIGSEVEINLKQFSHLDLHAKTKLQSMTEDERDFKVDKIKINGKPFDLMQGIPMQACFKGENCTLICECRLIEEKADGCESLKRITRFDQIQPRQYDRIKAMASVKYMVIQGGKNVGEVYEGIVEDMSIKGAGIIGPKFVEKDSVLRINIHPDLGPNSDIQVYGKVVRVKQKNDKGKIMFEIGTEFITI